MNPLFIASSLSRFRATRAGVLALFCAGVLLQGASAATVTWSGATNGLWGTAGNWNPGSAPTLSDDIIILGPSNVAGALTINVSTSANASSINFTDTSAVSLTNTTSGANQTLTINGTGGITTGTGSVTIGSTTANQGINIALGANQTWTVGAGGLTVNNAISGTNMGITKNGTGTLTLNATNTFTGAVVINAGTLATGSAGLLADTANVTVNSGGNYTVGAADTINSISGSGDLRLNAGLTIGTSTFGGNISGASAIATGGTLTFSGNNTNWSGGITVTNGAVFIAGADNAFGNGTIAGGNSFSATIRSSNATDRTLANSISRANGAAGTLVLGSAGTGNLTFQGGYSSTNNFNLDTIQVDNAWTQFNGAIASANTGYTLTKTGNGTLILNGNNTYTHLTTISAGTLQIGASGLLGGGSYSGNITINGLTSAFLYNGTNSQTLSGIISGNGALTKNNTGTLILTGANTYNGTTTINAGTLQIGNGTTGSIDNTSSIVNNGALIFNKNSDFIIKGMTGAGNLTANATSGAYMRLGGNITTNGSVSLVGRIRQSAATTITASSISMNGTLASGVSDSSYALTLNTSATNGTITLDLGNGLSGSLWNGASSLSANAGTGTLTFQGANGAQVGNGAVPTWDTCSISLTGGLNISTNLNMGTVGTLTLNATATSAVSGNLTFATNTANTWSVSPNVTMTVSGILAGNNASLTKNGTGTLTMSGVNTYNGTTTINTGTLQISSTGLLGGGNYSANISNSGTFIVGANSNQTLSGVLSGTGALTKNGVGTLTLSNAANTFNGSTTVNAGTLAVSGNISSSAITLNSGGVISAGSASAVTKFNAASLTVNGGSGYAFTITNVGASVAGTDYDQIALSGALTLNNTAANTFTIYLNGTPTSWSNSSNYTWTIISAASQTGFNSGNFAMDFSNFGIASGNRTGLWSFTNPSAGNLALTYTAAAATSIWSGAAGNWSTGFSPSVATDSSVTFTGAGGTATNDIASGTLSSVNFITFNSTASSYTLAANAGSAGASSGTALTVKGDITNNSANAQTINMALAIGSTSTGIINTASGNITIGGVISGVGSLVKQGNSTLTLSGNNTYGGATTISAGTLEITSTGLLGGGNYTQNIANSGTFLFGSNSNQIFSGLMSGNGALTKNGTGTVTLSGINSYTGTTTLNAGQLNINSSTALGGGTFTITGGTIDNTSGSAITLANNNAQNWNGNFTYTGTNDLNLGAGAVAMNANRTVTVSAGNLTAGGVVSGASFGITKNGSGTLVLTGANTYTGATVVNTGTLKLQNNTQNSASYSIASGSVLELVVTSGTMTPATSTISGGGTLRLTGGGALAWSPSAGTFAMSVGALIDVQSGTFYGCSSSNENWVNNYSDMNIASGAIFDGVEGDIKINALTGNGTLRSGFSGLTSTITIGQGNGTGTFNGNITNSSAAGNIVKTGTGTQTFTGNNTYNGTTTINGGTLTVSGGSAIGDASAVTVASGAVLNLGASETVGSIAGAGNVTLGSFTLTAGGDNTSRTSSGVISGSGALTKNGSGTLTLSGNNTYSGGTTLNAGTLTLGSNSSVGTGAVTMSAGAVGGAIDVLTTSNIALSNNFTLSSGTQYFGRTTSFGNLTLSGVLSGTGNLGLNFTSGSITLTGLNTFTGNLAADRYGVSTVSGLLFNSIANSGQASAIGAGSSINGGASAGSAFALAYIGNASATSNRTITTAGAMHLTSNVSALTLTGNITTGLGGTIVLGGFAGGGANYNEISGIMADTGSNVLSLQVSNNIGDGVWRISGNNTFTGTTIVSGSSTMIAAHANAFGNATTNGTSVTSNGQLLLTGGIAVGTEALTLNSAAGATWSGTTGAALRSISGNNSWAGNITLSQATTIATNSGSNFTISGGISGANNLTVDSTGNTTISGIIGTSTGTLTKNGTGTLLLTANNTYTGATTVNAGTLELSTTGLLGGGSYSGNIANTGTLLLGSNSNQTLSGVISGTGVITKNGTGTLTISNAASTYTGTLTINTGRISAGTANASAKINAGSLTIGAGTGYDFTISSVSSSVAGTDYDQIALTGAANFNNTAASQFTVYLNGTPTGWSNTAVYSWDMISAASQTGFTAGNFTLDYTNFGIVSGNRTGTWTFSNPSAGIIQLTYSGATGNSTWNTGTASWGTAGSWVENTTPVNFNNLTFNGTGGGTATNNISNGTLTTVNNITFASGAGAYTIAANAGSAGASGGTALIVTGTITNNSTNAQTLSTDLSFVATRTVNTASGNITLSGVVSGAGGLAKTGANTLILSGNNTYSGVTTISAGTLSITSTGLLGGGNYSQAISNSGAIIFGSNSNQTLGGVISGTGALTKNGTGTLTLTNSANSYTGTTTINAGAVAIGANMSIGAIAGSGNLSVGSGFTLTTNSSSTTAHSGVISGSGGLTKTGTGTLTLNGSSTYSGTTTLSAGTLNINSAAAIGTGTLTITGGTIDNTSSASQTLANNNAQNWNGDFSFNGTKDLNLGTGAVTMNAARTVTVSNGILTVGGAISGANLGLTKNGTGTLMLSGNSTYTGTTTVNSGTLSVFKTGSLGGNGSVTIGPAGTLSVDSSSRTMSNNITLSGGTLRGGFQSSYGTGGTITVSGTLVTHVFTSNGTLVLPNAVSASELLVGGGGGAQAFAGWYASGGGGGQVLNLTSQSLSAGNTTITVGAGGAYTSNGSATSIGSNTAVPGRIATVTGAGGNSGSGMAGGAGTGVANGGGGGDSAVGGVGTNPITGGAGGAGSANTAIQGLTGYGQSANGLFYFGGGGGGGAQNSPASVGGLGGGGGAGVSGTANTGGGAGGGGATVGGSGLAVVQYAYGYAAGNLTLAGTLDVQSASTLDVYTNGSLLNITGLMQTTTGSGGITIASSLTSGGIVRYSNAMTYAGDTTINSGAILQMNATNAMTNGAGKGNLIVTGTLDLNGQSGTTINGLSGNGVIDNTSGAGTYTLSVGGNNTSGTFDGIIKNTSGSLALTKNGTGTLTLTGNNTFTGTTSINAGTVVISHANALGTTGNITFSGGALQYGSNMTADISSRIKNSGSAILVDTNSNNVTFASAVDSTNSGGLTKNGTGTLTLNATNAYTGTTTINTGTLQIASAGLLGSGNYSGNISNSGAFVFGSNSNQTLSGNISGIGSLTKNGSGVLTLTGTSSFNGATTINSGTLVVNGSAANSAVTIATGATLGGTGTVGATTVSGTIAPGNSPGTLTVGSLTLNSGGVYTWEMADATGVAGTGWDRIASSGLLTVNSTSGSTFTIAITSSGAPSNWNYQTSNQSWDIITYGSVSGFDATKFSINATAFGGTLGAGNSSTWAITDTGSALRLTYSILSDPIWAGGTGNWTTGFSPAITNGANSTFTGAGGTATNNIASATLSSLGSITFNSTAGAYTLAADSGSSGYDAASAFTLNGNIVNNSTATQTINLALTSNATRVYDAAAGNITIGGPISGTGGLTKNGSNTLALSGVNTYTGATTINAGTLTISGAGQLGSGNYSGNISNAGTFNYASSANQTLSGIISGTGALTKNGASTLTLTGVNTYTGATTITAGTLTIGGAGQLGSGNYSGNIANSGTFVYGSTANQTLGGTISGTGALIKNANSTLTLSHANTYNGSTTINAGTLTVSAANALGATTQVILNTGGSLLIGASDSINDGAAVTLAGGKVEFTGNINETLGLLSMAADSIIDMAGGNIWLEFAGVAAVMDTFTLKVYNYTLYSDHLYFTSSAFLNNADTLSHIRFFSDNGTSFIGNSFVENSLSPYHVRPVPEPETYATAALLLFGLGIYAYRRRQVSTTA